MGTLVLIGTEGQLLRNFYLQLDARRNGALRRSGRPAVGGAAFIKLVLGDFNHPGDFRRHKNRVAAGRVGNGDLNLGSREVLLTALETQPALGHVFTSDYVVEKA